MSTLSLRGANAVIVALDATRDRNEHELHLTMNGIRMRGDILRGGDSLLVFGVLHTVTNPMGYPMKACTDSFAGTNSRLLEEEVLKKVDMYESMLAQIAERCKEERVSMDIKITAGTPTKVVILQEVISSKATWLILDRHLRKDLKFYLDHIPCKVALIQDSLSVEVRKPFLTIASGKAVSEQKFIYSIGRPVLPNLNRQEAGYEKSIVSCGSYAGLTSFDSFDVLKSSMISSSSYRSQGPNSLTLEETESSSKLAEKYSRDYRSLSGPEVAHNRNSTVFQYDSTEKPILCALCGLRSVLYIKDSMRFQYSEIQHATSNFSKENFLGEGGFGHVHKGKFPDGLTVAAKGEP